MSRRVLTGLRTWLHLAVPRHLGGQPLWGRVLQRCLQSLLGPASPLCKALAALRGLAESPVVPSLRALRHLGAPPRTLGFFRYGSAALSGRAAVARRTILLSRPWTGRGAGGAGDRPPSAPGGALKLGILLSSACRSWTARSSRLVGEAGPPVPCPVPRHLFSVRPPASVLPSPRALPISGVPLAPLRRLSPPGPWALPRSRTRCRTRPFRRPLRPLRRVSPRILCLRPQEEPGPPALWSLPTRSACRTFGSCMGNATVDPPWTGSLRFGRL